MIKIDNLYLQDSQQFYCYKRLKKRTVWFIASFVILGLVLYSIVSKTSSKNKTKHYLVGFLNLLLADNNTYTPNVRNLAVKNVSRANVLDLGLKKQPS